MVARKINLPTFTLTELCESDHHHSEVRNLPKTSRTKAYSYNYKPVSSTKDYAAHTYNHMPIILEADGKLWKEANLYILSKLEDAYRPSMTTYQGLADDLVSFRRFLDEDEIDFKSFPKRKLHRITYRYRAHLEHQILAQEIAPTTARRRMGTVVRFYRWMAKNSIIHPEFSMFEESDIYQFH